MDSRSWIKDGLPAQYAALADTPRVMAEARDALPDLEAATREVGDALVEAGLPRRAWRAEQASLHLLSPGLPAITLDAYLARLEQLATRAGPAWLRGNHTDLAALSQEVAILSNLARSVQEVVHRLQDAPVGPRGEPPLQRVMRHPRLQAPLDTIAELLSDLEALAPFMRPLPPERWRALPRAPGPRSWPRSGPLPVGARAAASRPWIRGRSALKASGAWLLQRLAALRRWPRAQRWPVAAGLLLTGLLLMVAALAALALSHRPDAPRQAPTLSSSAVLTALAGSGAATAPVTGSPAPSTTPRVTPAPAPKLALTCVVHGATATLTIKNAGASSLTWQAQPPPTLTVAPAQGALQAGQSAAAQVSAVNKRTVSGTITVLASHEGASIEDKVSCR
jgi:hypothetical protein